MTTLGGIAITGGGRGIGAAIARAMLAAGYHVAVLEIAALDPAELEVGPHPELEVLIGDARDPQALDRLAAAAGAGPAGLVGFVANAGYNRPGPTDSLPRESWDEVIGINLSAAYEAARAAERHRGDQLSFVAISSFAGLMGLPGRVAYSAAKAGVTGLVRSLAVEWAGRGMRMNAVAPGFIATRIVAQAFAAGTMNSDAAIARTPLGRMGSPDDVAEAVRFLLSPASSYITGVVLPVDGGAAILGLPADT